MAERKVTVRYVGPFSSVEVPDVGAVCDQGAELVVPASLAGRPASGTPGKSGYDPGEGLLAQADNWVAVEDEGAAAKNGAATKKSGSSSSDAPAD